MPTARSAREEAVKGFWKENPVFVQVLGMCPALAVTNSAMNGVTMGVATTFVLVGSSLLISLAPDIDPEQVRISTYIVIIATFVTVADFTLQAIAPAVHKELGAFIAAHRRQLRDPRPRRGLRLAQPGAAGAGRRGRDGRGFTVALVLLGAVREVLGSGSFFGVLAVRTELRALGGDDPAAGRLPLLGLLLLVFAAWERAGRRGAGRRGSGGRARRRAEPGEPRLDLRERAAGQQLHAVLLPRALPVLRGLGPLETAFRLGLANIFVMVITSLCAVGAQHLRAAARALPAPDQLHRGHRQHGAVRRDGDQEAARRLFRALGIFLPLITTNCAILGLALFQTSRGYDLVEGLVFAVGAGRAAPWPSC